jgi:hypothetical protein
MIHLFLVIIIILLLFINFYISRNNNTTSMSENKKSEIKEKQSKENKKSEIKEKQSKENNKYKSIHKEEKQNYKKKKIGEQFCSSNSCEEGLECITKYGYVEENILYGRDYRNICCPKNTNVEDTDYTQSNLRDRCNLGSGYEENNCVEGNCKLGLRCISDCTCKNCKRNGLYKDETKNICCKPGQYTYNNVCHDKEGNGIKEEENNCLKGSCELGLKCLAANNDVTENAKNNKRWQNICCKENTNYWNVSFLNEKRERC